MFVNVRGFDIYAYTGSRAFDRALPTIAFVHGAANDHGVWALQSRYFAHHGRNAVAVDLPGHGRSKGEPLPSVTALADWLAALLDTLHVERAVLVGHSMGALAALDAAGRHPGRVAKLALLGSAVPMPVSDMLLEAAKRDDHVAFDYADGLTEATKIRCPVLLILGQRDQMAPAKNSTALIAALTEKRVVTIPDCGHSLMTEAPDTVLDAMREFLS